MNYNCNFIIKRNELHTRVTNKDRIDWQNEPIGQTKTGRAHR